MMDDQMHTHIDYQVMAQSVPQDVTVTFADGISFTARYCGSGIASRKDGDGERYSHITLNLISPLDATINAPHPKRCAAIRTSMSRITQSEYAKYPCVLDAGHDLNSEHV